MYRTIAALSLLLYAFAEGAAASIAVITSSRIPAYKEALEGLTATLGKAHAIRVVDVADAQNATLLEAALSPHSVDLIVTVGADAVGTLKQFAPTGPVVSTMIVEGEAPVGVRISGSVYLNPQFEQIVTELRRLYPDKARIGVVYNPASTSVDLAAWTAKARQRAYSLEVERCTGPDGLLKAFRALKGRVDFLLTTPDATLYSAATVKPLVLASLEHGVPIVGFSASFVRAGAAIGIYPDYRDIGRQTADVVRRCLAGERVAEEPRKLLIAANPRVLRLLGLKLGDTKEVMFIE
jgi:ABC-type uncharacterized transport system substrate-binding protein